jgi:peptide/nickel transport system ATP-binding protein
VLSLGGGGAAAARRPPGRTGKIAYGCAAADPGRVVPQRAQSVIRLNPVLDVQSLGTSFRTPRGRLRAVHGVSFQVQPGQTVCIAGESGCGKSVTALSIMGLLPDNARADEGAVHFRGNDLLRLAPDARRALRGRELAMIFQEPMTALNPVQPVGRQIAEVFAIHGTASRSEAAPRALAMLERVHIPDAARRYGEYPHQMSGGMKQRVMIAMALAHRPALLVADEPTTALDVTIQAQVLRLLRELQAEMGTGIVFVTHDLAVVAEIADEVVVMYAGRVVERASVLHLFERPAHPYTMGLLAARPRAGQTRRSHGRLSVIPGVLPALHEQISGCRYQARCPRVQARCRSEEPGLQAVGSSALDGAHEVACFFPGGSLS